ncbi:EAL domain-containing protein [Aurantimonas aggregata]|uniref:EAL domain-containing protein n=1 Tax=Aurantimonas aggregata TaxID=2047720 RepID=A0A6L9MPD7_9HYPH|nr:EAL domain-containing protein [Aurantimonas aggregata]NDV89575.1 EAL domain-containing protein [Aurantimonas aggregata]
MTAQWQVTSAADFRRSNFADRVLQLISSLDLPASLFELEVTESVFIGLSTEKVVRTLEALRSEGMTIALDDFGTGYASLTHLATRKNLAWRVIS